MKSKLKNPICITIVATILLLGMIFSGIALFFLPHLNDLNGQQIEGEGFKLEDLFNVGNLGSGNIDADIEIGNGGNGGLNLGGNIGLGPDGDADSDSDGNAIAYQVYASQKQNVYMKIKSFGDYSGRSWSEATAYTELISYNENQYSADYLTGFFLSENGCDPSLLKVIPYNDQYAIPYYTAKNKSDDYDIQTSDVCTQGTPPEQYRMYIYNTDKTVYSGSMPSYLKEYEKEYRKFVYENYLYVDKATYDFMRQKIDEQSLYGDTSYLIEKVANYIKSSAVYDLKYDRELDKEENIAIAFLDKYKAGICQHYATAATMLFRSLGIPARYTIGYATTTFRNTWVNVTSMDAHAWVEVYLDGIGWKYVEVTGSSSTQPPASEYEVSLYPIALEKQYDGTPLEHTGEIGGFEKFTEKGYTYQANIVGERTEPGKTYSEIKSITIYDENGNNVTEKFECKFERRPLHVYISVLTFASAGFEKVYDGTPLTNFDAQCYLVGGNLSKEETYKVVPTASLTEVGNIASSFNVTIINKATGDDITNNYKIVRNFGRIKVTPKDVTFKAGDAEKVYDGEALTCDDIKIIEGELLHGHTLASYTITGSQTNIGYSENAIDITSIRIVDKENNDVTSNYSIHTEKGKLHVTSK